MKTKTKTKTKTSLTLNVSTRKFLGLMGPSKSGVLEDAVGIVLTVLREGIIPPEHLEILAEFTKKEKHNVERCLIDPLLDPDVRESLKSLKEWQLKALDMHCNIINHGTNV